MTEKQIRDKMVQTATAWLGCKESNGTHKQIIDLYNSHKPLARNYKVKYTDAWCDTFASAVAIKAGMTDIVPTECGCENHITRRPGITFSTIGMTVGPETIPVMRIMSEL